MTVMWRKWKCRWIEKAGSATRIWEKGSGDARWDDSVKQVFKVVKSLDRPPPTNFPPRVTVRFDVQEETEPVLQ